MPSIDRVQFRLVDVSAGWLEVCLNLNDTAYDLSVSSALSEPLRDLFQGLLDLRQGRDDEYRHLEFEWVGEGWMYEWTLTPLENGMVRARVAFSGQRTEGGKVFPVWNLQFSLGWEDFAAQALEQGAGLLRAHGFAGYLERWGKDFPAGQMVRLGHALHGLDAGIEDFDRELTYIPAAGAQA